MSSASRSTVLSIFKKLHRTRQSVFQGDTYALDLIRGRINEAFKENKAKESQQEIQELIKVAEATESGLKTCIIQGVWNPKTRAYKLRITEDTPMYDHSEDTFVPECKRPVKGWKQKFNDPDT